MAIVELTFKKGLKEFRRTIFINDFFLVEVASSDEFLTQLPRLVDRKVH